MADVDLATAANGDAESVRPAGRFRLYLGAVAGVGKTCAMLDEGWRRFHRGSDVVIGFVETHGRPHTIEQIRDLEIVPRKVVTYRDSEFEEMDLEAVLARRPQVALIDELAHTNVPGSGQFEKRWQDVMALIEEGIAVISTVNIQHLESVADAVETITGVPIRERVPDWVVRKADQIELIDSSADQLRRRMLHGNIYPADKVPSALSGFFRNENLVALRELALRFVADETDQELLGYLRSHHTDATWDTRERILVSVTGAPGTDSVVRRAARIATRTKGQLLVVHVKNPEEARETDAAALSDLAVSVGGTWHEVVSPDPAKAIVDFAHDNQVTQIVVGASPRSKLGRLSGSNVVEKILRAASESDMDVHVISRRREPLVDGTS